VTQSTISHWLNKKVRPKGLQARSLEKEFPDLYQEIMKYWESTDE